jgi:hypothetical protein
LSEAGVRRPAFTRDLVIIGGCGHVGLPLTIALNECEAIAPLLDRIFESVYMAGTV